MAIVVKKLVKNASFLYKMKLVAGEKGLTRLVAWVHIIEDPEAGSFLHGNELVFTSGIQNTEEDWLLNFAKNIYEAKASAFVVNFGPYTKEIPQNLIDFCDEVSMPLFTIPWETRMVDMTRDFCQRIISNDQKETSISTIMKNLIFGIGDRESQVQQMERFGYKRDSRFCFFSITRESESDSISDRFWDDLVMSAEMIARRNKELFINFSYKESLILVLSDYADEEVEKLANDFLRITKTKDKEKKLYIGVSSNKRGIYNQDKNFEKAFSAMEMAKIKRETLVYYDKLDLYKLLFAVNDKSVLRGFYMDTIGKLINYDRENNTEYMNLLGTYLENNGSLQLVSEKLYVHRNTVTNQLRKIEKITGFNPVDLEDKVMLYLGYCIKNLI